MAIDYLKNDCSASSTLPCHVMLSLDIHNYKLQTKTVFMGYFTEVELFLFSFSFFLEAVTVKEGPAANCKHIFKNERLSHIITFSLHSRQGA